MWLNTVPDAIGAIMCVFEPWPGFLQNVRFVRGCCISNGRDCSYQWHLVLEILILKYACIVFWWLW